MKHIGGVGTCPECRGTRDGLRKAAAVLDHDGSDEDRDVAALALWTAQTHKPGRDGKCVACGEVWALTDDFRGCSDWWETRELVGVLVVGRVEAIMGRWKGNSDNG